MMIEREKKYLVDDNLFKELSKKSIYKLGVVQWYLDNCVFVKNEKCRIRYTVDKDGKENWIVAFKSNLFGDFQRIEEEYKINIKDLSFLKNAPVIAKIRHFLMFKPAEVSIDEFIELDYKINIKYLAEIETNEDFEKYEKKFGLLKEVGDFNKYTNKNLAKMSKLSPIEIINKVKAML